ncbi:hypothetical protein [Aureispira anguillae]|uniref:Uncharacterized protein n=1 Tax=Aureispira anguillae TaxID=2864201 RepID=A0A915YCV6_9BACT|nr:hypothetical protein [Aureispira anguillae]BDS10740.1 hypothetical protein AsAng_0014490 [Aureispira anguillae]
MIRTILFITLFSSLGLITKAQESPKKINTHLYPFNKKILNLQTLQYTNQEEQLAHSFKTDSKYAMRYKGLALDKIAYQGMLFEASKDNSLLFKNLETQAVIPLPNKEKGLPMQGNSLLLEATGGIVYIKPLKGDNGFMVYKYNAKGEEVFGVQVPHSEFVQHGELAYHLPYLGYTMHTANTIVFSSYVDRIPKTVSLSTLDGSVSNFDFSSVGVIRDAAMDMDIHGFIQLDKSSSSIKITYISDNFSVEHPTFKDISHAETLILDHTLILAVYNHRSPLVQLLGIDLQTKQIKWEANMSSSGGIANSTYFNAIWLSEYEGKILLESYETKGKFLQIFDGKTGKQLWKSF